MKIRVEARLSGSNIVVNIWSWAKQDDATAVPNVHSTLLHTSLDSMKTYLLLNDNGSMQSEGWELFMVEHQETCTVMTEEQQLFDGIATLAGRRKGRIDVLSPLGQTWCFFRVGWTALC